MAGRGVGAGGLTFPSSSSARRGGQAAGRGVDPRRRLVADLNSNRLVWRDSGLFNSCLRSVGLQTVLRHNGGRPAGPVWWRGVLRLSPKARVGCMGSPGRALDRVGGGELRVNQH
jgi:hypothetical protein